MSQSKSIRMKKWARNGAILGAIYSGLNSIQTLTSTSTFGDSIVISHLLGRITGSVVAGAAMFSVAAAIVNIFDKSVE